MKLWLDAQLSPYLSNWIASEFELTCRPVRDLDLRDAQDAEIFERAAEENAVVMTKDSDFAHLQNQKGTGAAIIWITVGNTSNREMKKILDKTLKSALELIEQGESLVEIADDWSVSESAL